MLAAENTVFGIEEVHLGLAADWGTVQRLGRKAKNHMLLRELCYTGRRFGVKDAMELGLVHSVGGKTGDEVIARGLELAKTIAEKSPVAIHAYKQSLNYALENSMESSLAQIRMANGAYLNSPDVAKAGLAKMQKRKVIFPKL